MSRVLRIALKVLLGIVGLLVLLVLGGYAYVMTAYPDVGPPPEIDVESTPAQIERGRNLAEHVAVCIDCHSTRDYSKFSGPIVPGSEGQGGEVFTEEMGFPGTFYARNITPHNIGDWSDGELYRLITSGVAREGDPIFPVMPYPAYGRMDTADVKAIIAYIRTLEPIDHETPASEPNFPMNVIMQLMPAPPDPIERPPADDTIAAGEYLVRVGACQDCHTPMAQGQSVDSMYLAGGRVFAMPGGDTLRSANITPDRSTGIGNWSARKFVDRFKQHEKSYEKVRAVPQGEFNTLMPWTMYAGMTEEDLRAIYKYLQTVPAKNNSVQIFSNH